MYAYGLKLCIWLGVMCWVCWDSSLDGCMLYVSGAILAQGLLLCSALSESLPLAMSRSMRNGDKLYVCCSSKPADHWFNTTMWTFVEYRSEGCKVVCSANGHLISIDTDKVKRVPEEPEEEPEQTDQPDNQALVLADKYHPPLALMDVEHSTLALSPVSSICPVTHSFLNRTNAWLCTIFPEAEYTDLEYFCNTKIPIPGWGGNFLILRQATESLPLAAQPLMYPRLRQLGLDMYHTSIWGRTEIRMQFADILRPCPMGQIWPYCASCKRFLCPEDGHRNGKDHQKALRNFPEWGVDGLVAYADFKLRWL